MARKVSQASAANLRIATLSTQVNQLTDEGFRLRELINRLENEKNAANGKLYTANQELKKMTEVAERAEGYYMAEQRRTEAVTELLNALEVPDFGAAYPAVRLACWLINRKC